MLSAGSNSKKKAFGAIQMAPSAGNVLSLIMFQILARFFFGVSSFRGGRSQSGTTSNPNHGGYHDQGNHLQVSPIGRQGGANPRSANFPKPTPHNANLMARCGVFLAPWEDGFEEELYRWRNDVRLLHLWNGDRTLVTRRRLRKELDELLESAVALLICHKRHTRPLGFVYACKATSPVQKHYSVGCFVSDEAQGKGIGPAAIALFVNYLFTNLDAPKLAFEVYGWNEASRKAVSHLPQFKLEGVRRGHVYYNGSAHDLLEFGLSREDFWELQNTAYWKRAVG